MAVIHHTTLTPTKPELLAAWLPSRPWYRGGDGAPRLVRAGGFRLDDPAGEVGVEFVIVRDTSGAEPVVYLAPLTYRGAPLDGAEHALVGTLEHGVLGRRWVYDACHDPVFAAQVPALIEGRVRAQAQSVSHTPDDDVVRAYRGTGPLAAGFGSAVVTDHRDRTELTAADGSALRVRRVLSPGAGPGSGAPAGDAGAVGEVEASWEEPDGGRERGVLVTVRTAPPAS
jgi:hypothetical protein